jgi:hypothetical protein
VLYTVDTIGNPPVFFSIGEPGELPRGFLLSASPSFLDPVALRENIAPYLESIGQGRTGLDVDPAPATTRLGAVYPNPSPGPFQLAFGLERAGRVRAQVVDVQGRLVATVADRVYPAGEGVLQWDGRDARGLAVSPGVYFMRVSGAGLDAARRMMVLR